MTTTTFEQDARNLHADGHKVEPGEIAVGVIIGRTSEFFDFFVFAIASVLVFPQHIFPYVDALTGTLYSFAIFALAFIARPFGTLIFGAIDHRYGRGAKLTTALFLLGGSTAAIAFLPGYNDIGHLAVTLLAIFRIGQGLALGGSWDGLASLLAMNAPEKHKGWWAMVPQLGAPLGLIVASLLFMFLVATLPAADFLDWGWRYPFFVAFAINVVALFARLRIVVTEEYEELFEQRELQPASAAETISTSWYGIVAGAFAPLASFALFHMVTVFPLSWVFLYTRETPSEFLLIEAVAAAIGLIAVVISGSLADRIGRRTLLGWCAVAIGIFAVLAPLLLSGGQFGEAIYMLGGFAILGLSFGQCSGALSTIFPPRLRYTASALTSDLAWLFGAGFAPFVALWISSKFGLAASGAYLFSGAVVTLLALWFNRGLAQRIE
ncbi:MFS transporter [Altericroceibacterium spongiae]|uniref:MFS transporter n=1 Tax=Altericroceibacterium spongiae TaxID=2320269 RepID=A0A420EAF1_9SPHN|nr:MFS transporter [Altericroceibacterium spongiae]RKF17659.1 MFS transporter [Altericroceibacterium spongiae]